MTLEKSWQFLTVGWWILHLFSVGTIHLLEAARGRKAHPGK